MGRRAIEIGYEKAMSAIIDSNMTALISCGDPVLHRLGPGQGLCRNAQTMEIVITSVFTAVYVTRLMVATWYAWRRPKTIVV